jgi:hypothetical protein
LALMTRPVTERGPFEAPEVLAVVVSVVFMVTWYRIE